MANIYPQGSSLTKFTSNQDNSQLSTHLNLAICQVCYGKQSDACKKPEFNVQIHICKTCNLSVHKACYGVPSNVENTFFCDRCVEVGPNTNLTCEICHQMNGALKKAGEFWVHVTCALFTKLTHTVDWLEMRPDALSPLNPDQLCNECSQVSHSTYKCEDCEKRSHVLCMLRDGTWNISALFQKRNEVYCEEHVKEEYCFCGKEYVDGQQYMICCDLCDIWYHGDCIGITQQVGETIDDFVCKFCDQWNSSVKKILKEDEKEKKAHVKIPKQLVNFKLKDWLILTRFVFSRAKKAIEERAKIEDMEDVMQLSAKLPFEIDAVITLNVKLHNAKNLISRSNSFVDKLHDDLEETEVRSLQELITEARTIGVYIPNVDKIQVHIENFERAKEIKALISNSKNYSFAESRSFYDNLVKQMEKPPSIVHELRNMIETCQKWIFDLKKKVETSKSENLENKILVSDMNIQIEMTADLSFNVDDDLVDIRNELTQAEAWDQKFMSLKPPIWPKEIEDLLVDTKNYACRTQNMLTAHQKYKDYMDWANLSRKYSSESDDLPNLERINEHITIGINQISEFIIIDDVKNPLQAKLDEAITWHNTAIQAIDTKASPLVISQLINQAKSLICKFPELDILEKRANIHNKILDTLNTKHKEHDLTLLLQEAYEFDADQDLIQAVKSKQTAITELKAKIWVGLAQENNTDTFIDLLEDLKNLKTDLNDEKLHLEDKIRSINWVGLAKETLSELEIDKKKGELEILKNLISKAEKITYKDTPAESMLEDLAYRLWELEYQRFEMCDEISLEQLQELDKRRIYLRNKRPESLEKYENTRLEVDQCVEFFESCLNQDIAAVFVGNLNELKQRLEFYKGKLDNFGIIFPEKYNKILLWDKWIDWSLLVDNLFAADQKPSIDNLYDANLEVVSLSINPGLPAFQNLTAEIASYESWLYKYTSFSSARRAYAKSNLEVKNYLKIALEKPKFTTCQLQDLLDGAKDLKTSCEEEINLIHQDLNKLQEWKSKESFFFSKVSYEDLLNDCKKSYDAFITNERYQEFSSIVKEYCYEMYVEYENYGLKLVSYDWNIRAQRILQNQVRIQEDEWDEIMSNLETLPEEFLDVETLEKIKITQSLKQQLENEAKKLKKIIPTDKHKAITYEELDMLHAQMSDCKIVLKDEAYVRSLLETTRELSQRFGNLMSNKGSVDEFKNLTEELEKHPISMADLLSKTRDILEKSNNVALRLRILKESAGRNKIDKSKAEQFLNDYKTCEFSLDDAENLIKDLDLGFEIISGGLEIIEKPDITIEELNILSGKLSNLHIYMGTDEKNLKTKIWKLKVKLAHDQRIAYNLLVSWLNEGINMKDNSLVEDVEKLENLVKKGDFYKEKLARSTTLDDIKQIENECEALPFDLAHAFIEHKARINLGGAKKEIRTAESSLKEDQIDPTRKSNIIAIEKIITHDPNFKWKKHKDKAKRLAMRLEEIFYKNHHGSKYRKCVDRIIRIIKRFQDFGDFSEKLNSGDIRPEELSILQPKECKELKVIKRIFDGEPKVFITINKHKLVPDSLKNEALPVKRQKIETKQEIPKEIPKIPTKISHVSIPKPAIPQKPLIKEPPKPPVYRPVPKPVSDFKVTSLISEVEAFKKTQDKSLILKKEGPTPLASEKYRHLQSDSSISKSGTSPEQEWKEMHKFRLEHSGFTTNEKVPEKRGSDLNEDLPHKRTKQERRAGGKFSSEEEEEEEEELIARPQKPDKEHEYNVLDHSQKQDFRKTKKKSKLYDPFTAISQKNKAPAGSLLKVWVGKLEYGKHNINVVMNSVDNIESFQKMPLFGSKISVQGRTKQDELEVYVSQNSSSSSSKVIATAWIEPNENNEREFSELARDLTGKGRSAVIRVDSSLTIYLTSLNESFQTFLASVRLNINRKIDEKVLPSISTKEKLGCILFYKRPQAPSSTPTLNPDVTVKTEPKAAPEIDDLPEKEQEMSPITSDEENASATTNDQVPKALQDVLSTLTSSGGNYEEILNNLKSVIGSIKPGQESVPNNSEINELISVIRQQVVQNTEKQPSNVQNVNQFLSQQYPQNMPRQQPGYMYMPPGYMYPPQPVYPQQFYPPPPPGQGQFYRPPSPERKSEDPRRQNRY